MNEVLSPLLAGGESGANPNESVTVKLCFRDKSEYPVAIPWLLPIPGVDNGSFCDAMLSAF